MAKKTASNTSAGKSPQAPQRPQVSKSSRRNTPASFLNNPYLPYLIIFLFSTAIYFNSIHNDYAVDDLDVIWKNKYTLKGAGGIKDLMTHDALEGFFGEKGSEVMIGGRYRPLSLVTFALEVQFFGLNPHISHGINILLFSLTCLLLFHLLTYILPDKKNAPFYLSVPFIATMLFAGHPIHTEVVANIKGRDEIMGLLFSLLALFAAVKYVKAQKPLYLIWGAAIFFLALLSKENTITFLAIVPLTYYFFTKANPKNYILAAVSYLIPIIIALYLRSIYTKSGLGIESTEILNNPFAYLPKTMDGTLQRYATIVMTFILYFKLLIFPHPLTIDYYYNQIPIINITNPLFLLSLLVNGALIVYAIKGLKNKELSSYSILYYFITFSIVSNLLFTVSMLMNERLIYTSSIGFCLLMAWLLLRAKDRFNMPVQSVAGILTVVLLLYSVKTISRNRDWSDDLTLAVVDAKTSSHSCKVKVIAGQELANMTDDNFDSLRRTGRLQYVTDLLGMNVNVATVPDSTLKREFLQRAMQYLDSSVAIYPSYSIPWMILGFSGIKLHRPPAEVIGYYEKAQASTPGGNYNALYYMGSLQLNNNMPLQAKENLSKAIVMNPNDFQCRFNLGLAYNYLGKTDSALLWFKKALEVNPHDGLTNYVLGAIYSRQVNDPDMSISYLSKAIEYNPGAANYYDELSTAYTKKGDTQKAGEYAAKAKQLSGQR